MLPSHRTAYLDQISLDRVQKLFLSAYGLRNSSLKVSLSDFFNPLRKKSLTIQIKIQSVIATIHSMLPALLQPFGFLTAP